MTDNDRYIQHHVRDLRRFSRPRRINQLPQRCAQGISQTSQRRCAGPTLIREPQVAVSRRCAETERLRQTDEDLPEHSEAEDAAVDSGAGIAQPVADQQERGGGDDGGLGPAFVEDPDDESMED